MQAIAEFEPGAAQDLLGVVFDIDDTLTRDGRLEEPAYRALWRLRSQGLHLLAVTGRPLGFAEVIARTWPVDVAVGENGAGYISADARGLHSGFYAPEPLRAAHARLLGAVRARAAQELPQLQLADDSWARRCDVAWDIGERVEVPPEEITKLRTLIQAEGARCLVSSVHAHAIAGTYDKATGAVLAGREALGLDLSASPSRWLFVGDSGNDAAAFAFFPLSAGVSNVRAHMASLPVPPRYVSEADRGRGFAEIAEQVLRARGE